MRMRFFAPILILFSVTAAWAGFQGLNGSTNLGAFNKFKCSTGLTCTKVGDIMSVESSPSISTGSLSITGADDGDNATLTMYADQADDNGDGWQLQSVAASNSFTLSNNTSGSQVAKLTVTTAGNATVAGTLTTTGALTTTAGMAQSTTAPLTRWAAWVPGVATNATSATPSATVVYLTQIFIPVNTTLTGAAVLNAATVGTNKHIFALFDSSGNVLANTTTAGTTTSGASSFQGIDFTGTYAAIGPRTYWVGLYMNGTTDRYYAIPSIGRARGMAGSVSAQTFGTVAAVTLPTGFTADVAPVVFVY